MDLLGGLSGNLLGGGDSDFRAVARWAEQMVPFAALLLILFAHEHFVGIVTFGWLTAVLLRANDIIRRQIALHDERWSFALASTFGVLGLQVLLVLLLFRGERLWRAFMLLPLSATPSFWQSVWRVSVTDCLVRYLSMMAKILLVGVNGPPSPRLKRRYLAYALTLVERVTLLYRGFLPLPIWYRFFLNDAYGHFFASSCSGVYLALKIMASIEEFKVLVATAIAFARREVNYGRSATAEEVMEAGGLCAICQERMKAPLALRCRHVFCEDCVSEWFDRERTCPLCRAVVRTAGLNNFGDGSTSLLLQLF